MSVTQTATIAKDHSLEETFATRAVDTRSDYSVIFQISADDTDAPTGNWTVEETNDPVAEQETRMYDGDSTDSAAVWVNISADTSRVTIIGTGLAITDDPQSTEIIILNPARHVRLVWTATSGGEGSLATVWVTGRE